MKTVLLVAVMLLSITAGYAQEPADALRYSWTTQSGTARNQAIGGASASLGGEFSTIFNNPAGLAFYKNDEFVLTPGFNSQKFKSTYRSSLAESKKENFHIGASGFVLALPFRRPVKLMNVTFALGVNRSADFNSDIYYKGVNTQSSYSEKYLEELINNNVTDPNDAANNYPFGSSLALNTYIIDTLSGPGGAVAGYKSMASLSSGLIQEQRIKTRGGATDIALSGSANFLDKWYFGGTISIPILYYDRESNFKESDATSIKTNNFNYFEVNETLKTNGVGINGKFGVIYKPVEYVRLGFAVHTPTFYELTDKFTAEVITDLEGYGGGAIVKKQSSNDFTGNQPGKIKYQLVTPWRAMISGSYVFREVETVKRQKGFITADLEYVNYKASSFHPAEGDTIASSYFKDLNNVIDQQYKGNINFRVGGELKFNTIMARLGGAYYGNPYKNEKGNKMKLSGGLGYRDRGMFIDLTYVYSMGKDAHYPYRLENKANEYAVVKSNSGNIVATIGFKL